MGKADNKFWNIMTKWLSDSTRESNMDDFTGYSYTKLHEAKIFVEGEKFL